MGVLRKNVYYFPTNDGEMNASCDHGEGFEALMKLKLIKK